MAGKEELKALRKGVKYWNSWREAELIQTPDLSNHCCFDPSDFSNINLSFANLSNSRFYNCNFDKANVENAIWSDSEITNCSFVHSNLKNATVIFSKLNGSDFSDATLTGLKAIAADFSTAQLRNTNMSNSTLAACVFWGANLTNVNLTSSNLQNANFTDSILDNTDFKSASIGSTLFLRTSLNDALNLSSLFANEKSIIDLETIIKSRSQLKTLISKIGIPMKSEDHVLDIFDSSISQLYPVFLSHSSIDKPFASKVYNELSNQGCQIWYDEYQINPGDVIHKKIYHGIENFDKLLLICSENSLNSWWVNDEIEKILAKERQLTKKYGKQYNLLIPIKIDDYVHSWDSHYKTIIEQRSIGDFKNWNSKDQFEKSIAHLMKGLSVINQEKEIKSFL